MTNDALIHGRATAPMAARTQKPKQQPGGIGLPFWLLTTGERALASRCVGEFRLTKRRYYFDDFVSVFGSRAL